jgi:hypothetical protein
MASDQNSLAGIRLCNFSRVSKRATLERIASAFHFPSLPCYSGAPVLTAQSDEQADTHRSETDLRIVSRNDHKPVRDVSFSGYRCSSHE